MEKKKHLYILWTNPDPLTAKLMVMMYATNSLLREWWEEVTVCIWGATTKLVAENSEIQAEVLKAQKAGVKFEACIACARELGVIEDLEKLGVKVFSWGPELTERLKNDDKLITI